MKVRVFIFTYFGDADLILGKIENSQWAFPGAPIHVVDDARRPMPEGIVKRVQAVPGVFYELSDFNRGGNLNGGECIRAELDIFMRYTKFDEVMVKTDPDAFVFSKDMDGYLKRHPGLVSTQVSNHPFSGYFYAIAYDVLAMAYRWLLPNEFVLNSAPEDVVICSTACACAAMFGYKITTLHDIDHGGRTGAFDYSITDSAKRQNYISNFYNGGHIMCLGNVNVSKADMVKAQAGILKWIKTHESKAVTKK